MCLRVCGEQNHLKVHLGIRYQVASVLVAPGETSATFPPDHSPVISDMVKYFEPKQADLTKWAAADDNEFILNLRAAHSWVLQDLKGSSLSTLPPDDSGLSDHFIDEETEVR